MRYELMLPHQIRAAIEANWPVDLPLGVRSPVRHRIQA